MQMILSYYNVPNTLSRYISATSSFDIPKMEEIYAAASFKKPQSAYEYNDSL